MMLIQRELTERSTSVLGAAAPALLAGLTGLVSGAAAQASATAQAPTTAPIAATAFVHVAVVPMDRERVLPDQTVVVRDGRIVALGPAAKVAVPAGATQIDGRSKYLLPGLADMHNHSDAWFSFLASGVTIVRNPGGSIGAGAARRAAVAATGLPGPHVYSFGTVTYDLSPAQAVQSVIALKAAGDVAIKSVGLEPEAYDSVVAAARRVGLKLVGHVPRGRTLESVLASGQWASIEHLTGYVEDVIGVSGQADIGTYTPNLLDVFGQRSYVDTAAWLKPAFRTQPQLRRIAKLTRQAGVWNCPTLLAGGLRGFLDAPDNMLAAMSHDHDPGLLRHTSQRAYDLYAAVANALQDAGAGLILGTDGGPFDAPRELQLLVQAGLTPYQALATGTRNVAQFLGTLDSTGTVAIGKRADLILLGGNPLRDVRHTMDLAGVMATGHWLPRAMLDARLDSLGLRAQRDTAWQRPITGVGGQRLPGWSP